MSAFLTSILDFFLQATGFKTSDIATMSSTTDDKTKTRTVHIGTRKSALALAQTDIVRGVLERAYPDIKFEVHAMATMGDKNQVTALHDFGAKSLWTHELEASLLKGELHLIVHSLKG